MAMSKTQDNETHPLRNPVKNFIIEITGLSSTDGLKWIYKKFMDDFYKPEYIDRYGDDKEVLLLEWLRSVPINLPLYAGDDGMKQLFNMNGTMTDEAVIENSIKLSAKVIWKGWKYEKLA